MCVHEVQFYEREAFLIERLGEFVGSALLAGDSAVVIATARHRALLAEALAHKGIDAGERLVALDARETLAEFMIDGWPDEQRFGERITAVIDRVSRDGSLRLHAFGEMVALLCADGRPEAAIRLETLWNELAKRRTFSLLCAYPVEAFGSAEQARAFETICAAHSHVSPCEQYETLKSDPERFHRTVASLQHKARSLEREIARREEAERAISRLAAHQEHIREDERKRIAREIHDELGGLLTGIKAYVSVAMDSGARRGMPADAQLRDAAELADAALATVRRIITDLRPSVLDELGVWAAIEWYASQVEKQAGLVCALDIDEASANAELDTACSTAVFRIVQEAMTNVVRHAEASRIDIRVRHSGGALTVAVVDDGKGLVHAAKPESWGIAGMHERARHCGAKLKVAGAPMRGTTVSLSLPPGAGNVGS